MAKQRVIEIECDKCGYTTTFDQDTHNRQLPDNWVALTGTADGGYLFELELCPKCMLPIMKAIKKGFKE